MTNNFLIIIYFFLAIFLSIVVECSSDITKRGSENAGNPINTWSESHSNVNKITVNYETKSKIEYVENIKKFEGSCSISDQSCTGSLKETTKTKYVESGKKASYTYSFSSKYE